MITPSLSQPWVLIRYGDAPPALACLIRERGFGGFVCDVMVTEINSTTGLPVWRKRLAYEITVSDYDIVHVFPGKPNRYDVAEARRALRRMKQINEPKKGPTHDNLGTKTNLA